MARAIWNQQVVAESAETLQVEGNHYFPPSSVRWECLHESPTRTRCPWKGEAYYFSVEVDGERAEDAAWTYPAPLPAAAAIAEHVAFWRGVVVEE